MSPSAITPGPMTRRDLEARMIAKAWKDPAYKKRLVTEPKAALQDELRSVDPSITLPDSLRVEVHEEAADLFHFVLPRNPSDISLSEVMGDNLEAVAPQTIAVVTSVVNVTSMVNNVAVTSIALWDVPYLNAVVSVVNASAATNAIA